MKKTFIVAAVALLGFAAMGAASSGRAEATPADKVVVCHATSGQGELKNGYNLITVSVNSVQLEAHKAHATTNPKVNQVFGDPSNNFYLYDYVDVDPANLPGRCGTEVPPPPPTPEVMAVAPTVTPPTCTAQGQVVLPTTEGVIYTPVETDGSVVVTAVAANGYVLADESETSWTFTATALAKLPADNPACVIPTPTPPQQPAETPVVAALPPTQPATETAVLAAVPAATAPTALPTTGNESWTIFLIGLASLLGGTALVKLSRRSA